MTNYKKVFKDLEYCEYKEEIIEIIENYFNDSFVELAVWLDDDINYNGAIDELIDDLIDMYYYDLRLWAVDNYGYIEDALNEFGTPKEFDYHKAIQWGQYMFYSEEINNCLYKMADYLRSNFKGVA